MRMVEPESIEKLTKNLGEFFKNRTYASPVKVYLLPDWVLLYLNAGCHLFILTAKQ